jgi:hypothetical protein
MDPRWWDDPDSKDDVSEPHALLAVLVCEQCSIRRRCLDEALKPDSSILLQGVQAEIRSLHQTWGVWGASTRRERARALQTTESPEAAAKLLEAELPGRIERRIRAWKTSPHSSATAAPIEPLLRARRQAS